jgi:hypothetical protein
MRKRRVNVEQTTLLNVCVAKVGFRKGARVFAFVMAWELARQAHGGRDIVVREYCEHSGVSRAQAFRNIADFRQVFDAQVGTSPNEVLRLIEDAKRRESTGQLVPGTAATA